MGLNTDRLHWWPESLYTPFTMPYEYTVEKRDGYLWLDVQGDADTPEDASWFAGEAVREAAESGCDRLLLDERKLNMRLTSYDVYVLAELLSEAIPLSGLRVATLHSEMNREVGQVFETMLQNRSMIYRSFVDERKALDWLVS